MQTGAAKQPPLARQVPGVGAFKDVTVYYQTKDKKDVIMPECSVPGCTKSRTFYADHKSSCTDGHLTHYHRGPNGIAMVQGISGSTECPFCMAYANYCKWL